jgi:hypothetical protein
VFQNEAVWNYRAGWADGPHFLVIPYCTLMLRNDPLGRDLVTDKLLVVASKQSAKQLSQVGDMVASEILSPCIVFTNGESVKVASDFNNETRKESF